MPTKSSPRAPVELDLDSLLRSHGADDLATSSSDEDAEHNGVHRRTVDEILNDSSSSSDVDDALTLLSSNSLPKLVEFRYETQEEASPGGITETLEEPTRTSSVRRSRELFSASLPSFGLRSYSSSRPLPPLFGGVRPNPKPGAALAAASAASRSHLTPHAAAIKCRRASNDSLEKSVQSPEPTTETVAEESARLEVLEGSDFPEITHLGGDIGAEDHSGVNGLHLSNSYDSQDVSGGEVCSSLDAPGRDEDAVERMCQDEEPRSIKEDLEATTAQSEAKEDLLVSSLSDPPPVNLKENAREVDHHALTSDADNIPCPASAIGKENVCLVDESILISVAEPITSPPPADGNAENMEIASDKNLNEDKRDNTFQDEVVSVSGDAISSKSEISEQLEEKTSPWNGSNKSTRKADRKLRSSMKPLEWAEELEKKRASSSLQWQEGAAAQPMRLEGIRRGPPAVGYLQIDSDNAVTRAISSQAFRRDHGSPEVLAVHMNFIAISMSKGAVLIVPSKYSAHIADDMDAKMLVLGSQGEKPDSTVTAMCFNHQGDLLLAGYSDGHLTVWDVLKAAAAKTISGEHTAPVVHTLFLWQDSQVTRQFKAVTGDSKGLLLIHTFSVLPLINVLTINTQCLLDGQRTGTVISASPLVMDDTMGGLTSVPGNPAVPATGIGSMMGGVVGGVVGGESGRKLFKEGSSLVEEGVVILATHQNILVVRLSPSLEVYEQLNRPDGVREGSMPYTAWKCPIYSYQTGASATTSDKASWLAIAWDRKVLVAKLVKSKLEKYRDWTLDSAAIGVTWLDDQMLLVLTLRGQLCLFANDGTEIHRTSYAADCSGGDDIIGYHTHFTNVFGNPEKAYHNSVAVRGATIYILGPMHLIISRLLPWKERIQVLQKAGDWMGAFDMAMRLYDGHAHGVIDLPRTVDAIRGAIMPYLVELLLSYVDEVFSYISVACGNEIGKIDQTAVSTFRNISVRSEIEEEFARVGGVAVEFCVHIKRTDILFDDIFSKFVAVQHGGTFLEILEPYILKDMLGCLPPEVMQALVEHYSVKGWLQRVEQCVLHMDISSLDFNQVVRLCREHGLYGALIYLFNRGLDDFKAPLEELLVVVQNVQRADAAVIGYRMLVYLKYCFLGLAFPPGHGTLPSSRLPSLRKELLQFLLEDSNVLVSEVLISFMSTCGACPNFWYLLWLDIEATLEVLRCAFVVDMSIKALDTSHAIDSDVKENIEEGFYNLEGGNVMLQNTINSLILFLDMESDVIRTFKMDHNGSIEFWPSKKDISYVFEFIAFFVACKRAYVSEKVLKHILEYLIANDFSMGNISRETNASQREKQVLSLLKNVHEKDWDSTYVLRLCEDSQYYQVCGFIHTIRGHYIDALDNYMKDLDEPTYTFAFIHDLLLQLKSTESSYFRLAVQSRIPKLVELSREGTFFMVIDHFSTEREQILFSLQSHPQSLFLFLKAAIDVHLYGTLDFSSLLRGHFSDDSSGMMIEQQSREVSAYLKRLSNFTKPLYNNPFPVTDEVAESYLELLCQYERSSVLKFLESFDNYRLEHCLRLCQEYKVTDAAAFLLERVGDVGSALVLAMSGLDENFDMLVAAVGNVVSVKTSSSTSEVEQLNTILRTNEIISVQDVLHTSIGICQRNTLRLDPQESEFLWFKLFDSFCGPLRQFYDDREVSEGRSLLGTLVAIINVHKNMEDSMFGERFNKGVSILRRVFSQFVGEVVEGMVGYIPLPAIMAKLLSDNGNQEFGDLKLTILGLLGKYGYERRILGTAKSLIEDDTFYTMSLLKKGASHAYAPQDFVCNICGCLLTKENPTRGIRLFSCGHATHLDCESQENEQPDMDPLAGCVICMPKKKTSRPRNKSVLIENGLIKSSAVRSRSTQGVSSIQHVHEPEAVEKPFGPLQMPRFEMLSNLRKTQRSLQMDVLPQLRLSPPALYHDKVQKGTVVSLGGSNQTSMKSEKTNKSRQLSVSKGLASKFPSRTSIFGNERNRIQ